MLRLRYAISVSWCRFNAVHCVALELDRLFNGMNILNRLPRLARLSVLQRENISYFSTETNEPPIPKNSLKDVYSANNQSQNGVVYDKKPFKLRCIAGKTYSWCLCGQSKNQPLCDETKEYWLCNCKQTSNRPFCDGTHKRPDIQEKKR